MIIIWIITSPEDSKAGTIFVDYRNILKIQIFVIIDICNGLFSDIANIKEEFFVINLNIL